MIQNRTILLGDVLEKIKEIPPESIDCIITSPPYWGLRDYKIDGQCGLEPDFRDYLAKLRELMNQLKLVLKKTGTCWINLGDTYNGTGDHTNVKDFGKQTTTFGEDHLKFKSPTDSNIQRKSRYGIPERFYTQCIDDRWIARNNIPWIKENSMPSSVKDRFTNKYEPVFFFAKYQKYYFNLDAVREKPKTESKPFNIRVRENITGKAQQKLGEYAWTSTEEEMQLYDKSGVRKEDLIKDHKYVKMDENYDSARLHLNYAKKQDLTLGADGKPKLNYEGFNERWKNRKHQEQTLDKKHSGIYDMETGESLNHPNGKNPGDIFEEEKWKKHYDENGFCLGCGEHWSKHTVSQRAKDSMSEVIKRSESICWCNPLGKNPGDVFKINPRPFPEAHFATFPVDLPLKILKCACPPKGIVLDPFFGAGTVGVAAEMLELNWIGIELKKEYCDIAMSRLRPFIDQQKITGY